MEALVQEKILSSFVNEVSVESETIKPINVDIKKINVTRMIQSNTMTTNDGNYFIRYGGYPMSGAYNAIEVYSVNSLDNSEAVYVFSDIEIDGHTVYINELKQAEDGRFYGIGEYLIPNENTYSYLIIFNNFIQDGYCQINKYYTETNIGVSVNAFQNVAKVQDAGIYFITAVNKLIRFEINILEGNKTSIATIVDGGTITEGSYRPQLNVFKDKLIYTRLWETEDYKYEYTKAVINVNEELPSTVILNSLYDISVGSIRHISGATNNPFEAIIPFCSTLGYITIYRVNIDGEVSVRVNTSRTFNNNTNLYAYLTENYASITDNNNIYLMYFDENAGLSGLTEFYSGTFSGNYSNTQTLKQNNIINLIGTAVNGTQQSIVSIKNIYSPNVTSEPYFEYDFCLPYYMNLYSNSEDDTSLIFSRDATARFYSGNQITSTFIVPNYLLNDGNIEKASVYGKTNYLLNSEVEDYQKNRFESLYFNFIYNLNVIDNTNGLNTLNQIGSNKVANGLWKTFDNYDLKLTKARITYEDLSTEIIELTLVNVVGGTAIFNYNVNGNITQIEYLSNDESTVYATYKRKISGSHTITQVVKTIPNDIGTANGTSIYISDSSNLTFANIQINGNSVQDGTPTPSNQVPINSAGDNNIKIIISNKNLFNMDGKPSEDRLSSAGYTLKYNDDKTITINGTGTGAYKFLAWNLTLEAGTYIASGCPSGGSQNGYSFLIRVGSSSYWDYGNGVTFTLIAKTTIQVYPIRIGSNIPTFNNVTFKPMIRLSSTTDASFVPHQEQNISIPCQQPMRSIGNVRDSFVKMDGVWYEKHVIGQVVLNGSERSGRILDNNQRIAYNSVANPKLADVFIDKPDSVSNLTPSLSTHFSPTMQGRITVTNNSFGFSQWGGQKYIYISAIYDNIEDFKTWLSTHNTEVIYQLAEPIYLECTEEQITALENMLQCKTYEPVTNINSLDITPAYLEVLYYKQL